MLRDAYRLFETPEGGFLLFRLDDFMKLYPEGFDFRIRPEQLERISLADRSGCKWVFFEEGEQTRDFIKLLSILEDTTKRKIKKLITRHPLSGAAEMMALIVGTTDPTSLEEIDRWKRLRKSE